MDFEKKIINPQQQARELYQHQAWGEGYIDVNDVGQVVVNPNGADTASPVILDEITSRLQQMGLHTPVLIRFPEILRHRVQTLSQAFNKAMTAHQYEGRYTPVYPIKVNQHKRVVQTLASAHPHAGLEAGSKPELMAVLALSDKTQRTIICNGYKDREYIQLALIAQRLGYNVIIIIEKFAECALTLNIAKEMGVQPQLGIRVRLASISKGKWQNTGGEKSKFGLTATLALRCIDLLREHHALDTLQVMHVHLGSQIANIRDIQSGLTECARYYLALRNAGAPIHTVDVGGGLGVDYEGSHSRHYCSMNYTMDEYAHQIIHAFTEACRDQSHPVPHIITESGRAMTAHHAILTTDIIGTETLAPATPPEAPQPDAHHLLHECFGRYQRCRQDNAVEMYHDAQFMLTECHSLFTHGLIGLADRAESEHIIYALMAKIRHYLSPMVNSQRDILAAIQTQLAQRFFVNFSLFQSLPDVWAIDQIFPIMPTSGLQKPCTTQAIIHDITCDSDGRIDDYIQGQNIEATLALPALDPAQPYHLAFFLVGAYQEILGDMHNLFGDTHTVHVVSDSQDPQGFRLLDPVSGQTVEEVLSLVQFDPKELLQSYQRQLADSSLSDEHQQQFFAFLADSLQGYTYLED